MNFGSAPRSVGAVQSLEGPEEVILGAECDDVSVAVKIPREGSPDGSELTELVNDACKEFKHYAEVRGFVLCHPDRGEAFEEETTVAADGGVATGPGGRTRAVAPVSVRSILTALFAITVAIHGPLDVLLASYAWYLEGNSLTTRLGVWPWTAIKVVSL